MRRIVPVGVLLIVPLLPACSSASGHRIGIERFAEGETLVIGDGDTGCGRAEPARIARRDADTGDERWAVRTPWFVDPLVAIDDLLLGVTAVDDDNPPSVWAIAAADGTPIWQRFIESRNLSAVGVIDDLLVVEADDTYLLIDRDGAVTNLRARDLARTHTLGLVGDHLVLAGGQRLVFVAADGASTTLATASAVGTVFLSDDALFLAGSQLARVDPPGSAPTWHADIPFDDVYSSIERVELSGDAVLVVITSTLGPDVRTMVLDAATGHRRFVFDGARTAAIAGDVLLYDRREPTDPDATLTRSVAARDLATGEALGSRTPSAAALGGFAGVSSRGAVFVSQDANGAIAVSIRDPRTGDVVAGESGALVGAEGFRVVTGIGTDLVVGPQDIGAIGPDEGRLRWHVRTDLSVLDARLDAHGAIVATGRPQVGCD